MENLLISIIALSVLGIIDSGYLLFKYYREEPLVCPLNTNCNAVSRSDWSGMFGFRNEILGLIFYFAIIAGALFSIFNGVSIINLLMAITSGIAVAFAIFFSYIQRYVIKSYCVYCLTLSGINIVIFILSVALLI